MALELNVNSYAIATSADDYFATRLGSDAWDNASSTDKDSALVSASLELDNNNFIGQAVSTDQALAWPRNNATLYDNRMWFNKTYGNTEIPIELIVAVYEQALHILENSEAVSSGPAVNYENISVGSISLNDSRGQSGSTTPTRVSKFASNKLIPLLNQPLSGGWWRAN
jgi:hypothetical protein